MGNAPSWLCPLAVPHPGCAPWQCFPWLHAHTSLLQVIDPATQKVSCGAAVISCGVNGKKPKDTRKLSKKAALDLAKHSMGPFFPGAKGFGGLQLHGAPSDMVVEMELP